MSEQDTLREVSGGRRLPPPPPAPKFTTAPDLTASGASIPVPSFSSAPDLEELSQAPLPESKEVSKGSRKEKKQKEARKRHRRRDRSRSPSDYYSRSRSRSPVKKRRYSSRSRSRSPVRRRRYSSSRSRSPARRRRYSRSRSRSSERRYRRRRSPSSRYERSRRRSPIPLDTGLSFVIDTHGDMDNLTYEKNDTRDVPIYRLDITRKDKGRLSNFGRYSDPKYALLEDKSVKRIRLRPGKTDEGLTFSADANFISLGREKESIGGKAYEDEMISTGVDYRSLEGIKPSSTSYEEEEEGEILEEEEKGESFDEYIRRRTIEFNKTLDENPNDVSTWLAFIQFQDEAAMGLEGGSNVPTRTKATKSSLTDVKMSIFEKALEHNPANEELLLAYLACGEQIWDTITLLREWDSALKKLPESIRLWAEYINLRQTNFASFSFSQCVKVFEDCIKTLNKIARRLQVQRQGQENFEARENIESVMVYVLLRACLFMKQSGYHERAYSSMQAAVEFNLFQPEKLRASNEISFNEIVDEFGEFWSSELPRFGEKGAKGWREYYNVVYDDDSSADPAQDAIKEDIDNDNIFSIQDWARHEEALENVRRVSLRMSSADPNRIDEDPFIITMFDDIRGFLFSITTDGARQSLIYSIFVFLGLPFTPPGVGTNTHFCVDTFTHNDLNLRDIWPSEDLGVKLVTYIGGVPMEAEQSVEDRKPYDVPPSYPVGVSELFGRKGHWFNCLASCTLDCTAELDFTRNAFEQLLAREHDDHLAMCYLALESCHSYDSAKKLAKKLLSRQRTNFVLWNAYAQMEKSHDHLKEARKVYQMALATSSSMSEDTVSPLLCRMFAQMEWENGRSDEALNILVSMSDKEPYKEGAPPPSKPKILKARQFFSQKAAQFSVLSPSKDEASAAYHYHACYALFQYLTQGIDAGSEVYEQLLQYIQERHAERGFESESIWVSYAELLYRHATNGFGGYKPGQLRKVLERAVALFPNNTIFLGLFIWNEARTKLYNRVRIHFTKALESNPNVILWISAIYSELHHRRPYDLYHVRYLFEKAVDTPNTRPSILLWKLYIEHELRKKETEKAKSLFYQSIRACPWSKELCLLGIKLLGRHMQEKEIHEIISLMMEKEMRLRKPLNDDIL